MVNRTAAFIIMSLVAAFAPGVEAIERPPWCMDGFNAFDPVYEEELTMLQHHLAMVDWIVEDGLYSKETTRAQADAALVKLEQAAADLRTRWADCGKWE